MAEQTTQPTFENNEKILCFHGPLLYEAKVLKSRLEGQEYSYFVHYLGWKDRYDDWVPENRALKLIPENIQKRQELVALHTTTKKPVKKPAVPVPQKAAPVESRKRTRESAPLANVETMADFSKKSEIKILLPDVIKNFLVDEWEDITKNQKLVPLPRSHTAANIIDTYKNQLKSLPNQDEEVIDQIFDGVKDYFDKALGNLLLYKFERPQYVEYKTASKVQPSDYYGYEHLVRLFVQLPALIANTSMDKNCINIIKDYFAGFLEYLADKKEDFVSEYENATAHYISNLEKGIC